MLQRILPDQVTQGMFVVGFEGSWWNHPFWRNKFVITEADVLEKIRSADVAAVIVDTSKGAGLTPEAPLAANATNRQAASDSVPTRLHAARTSKVATDTKAFLDENARAAKIVDRSKRIVRSVFDDARLGKAVRTADVLDVVNDIAASIERSPKALLGLIRLKSKDDYTCLHSVAVCVLMINLARQLQLPPQRIHDLGIAGLLHDVGKMGVPLDVLNKPGRLDDQEFALIKGHPVKGFEILSDGVGVPDEALDVCRHHHEKMDGSGYPMGLSGDQISVAARMGAICDVYDALTSNRAYKDAWTPVEAVAAMRSWEGHFDPELMFTFMQSVAVYPTGMLVRLRSNRLAVILANGRRASRPRVKAFYATRDREMLTPEIVIIDDSMAHDQIIAEENPRHWPLDNWAELQAELLHDS